jgi:hypothetical protein
MTDVPSTLLRFFETEEYARQFVAGQVRFGLLEHYRTVERSRRDVSEGRASFDWALRAPQVIINSQTGQIVGHARSNQNIHYTGSSQNPYYILCASHFEVNTSALATKFGRFIVCINDPVALLERIKAGWQKHDWSLENSAFITPVEYNKDGLLEPDPCLWAPPHLCYSQKPESFREEREYRYLLMCTVDAKRCLPEYLTLPLTNCSDLCSLIASDVVTSK